MGIVGAGVIGGGWALHYLRAGFDVDVYDPAPQRAPTCCGWSSRAGRCWSGWGCATARARTGSPSTTPWPRRSPAPTWCRRTRRRTGRSSGGVLADVDRAARPEVVIASSTSGFAMTMLQADCEHPERCVVGHPFNPPYLIPVVEVVGGEQTDPAAVDWLVRFYASTGKRPLRLSRELPGFVGNRLQEAMWREALHMVAAGEATVEEIDAAIAFGPGLRWALMGPCLTFHLAGGGGGMAHMLDHFGAALEEPWTRLQAPPLTPELRDRMIEGCLREADGRSVAELERLRDGFLAELLDAGGAVRGRGRRRNAPAPVARGPPRRGRPRLM